MRRLLLLRHGKSDWSAPSAGDHDRPLAPRGRRAADTVGRWLAEAGVVPSLALTSTAVRASDTVARAVTAGEWETEVRPTRSLYMAGAREALALVEALDDDPEILLLAGHQPTMSSLVRLAIGGGAVRMPTAAVACLRFEGGRWADVRPGGFELEWHLIPRLLER